MGDFTPITTQEEFNAAVKDRLDRAEKKYAEATAELQTQLTAMTTERDALTIQIKEYNEKYAGVDEQIANLQKQIKGYETDSVKTRIARELGIPFEMRDRLRGETEEEIKADAQALVELLPKPAPPLRTPEPIDRDAEERQELKNMLKNI